MISDKSGLASRLSWVLAATEQVLEQTRGVFTEYVEHGEQASLVSTLAHSRDVLGILDLLAAEGACMLGRELVLLLEALEQDAVIDKEAAAMVWVCSLLQLADYLRHLSEGYADLPVIILPVLNDLRAARRAELLAEHLVFLPNDERVARPVSAQPPALRLSAEKRSETLQQLRLYMQRALLGWFNDQQPVAHLQVCYKVAKRMVVLHEAERTRTFWWVSAALFQGLAQEKLESSKVLKALMGHMEREIRQCSELGADAYEQALSDERIKNLLYYVGLAERGASEVDAVKDAYHLDLYLPWGSKLEELRRYYALPGRTLWQPVAASLQAELATLMSNTQELHDLAAPGNLLKETAKRTRSVGQTLCMLGLATAAELTLAQADAQQAMTYQMSKIASETLIAMRAHYLKLEQVVVEYAETGQDQSAAVFAADAGVTAHIAAHTVVSELLLEMTETQAELASLSQRVTETYAVNVAAERLLQFEGALDLLDCPHLMLLARGARQYIQQDLLSSQQRQATIAGLSCLADIIIVLEAALSCLERQEDYLPLLSAAHAQLVALDQFSATKLVSEQDMAQYNWH